MKKIRILINVPRGEIGGVANHYAGLKNKFTQCVKYYFIGGISHNPFFIFKQTMDYIFFIRQLVRFTPDIVHLNPSLDNKSLIRDAIFVILAKIFKKKIVIFFHGWQIGCEIMITQKYLRQFLYIYNKVDAYIVLCSDFKKKLLEWGINSPIFLETTKVDDDLIVNFNINKKNYTNRNILFLSRIEKAKGIYEVINAIQLLKQQNIKLIIAGTGNELTNVKQYVQNNNIANIEFIGFVSGTEIVKVFNNSLIYILPSYSEGMPNSVLEAMVFGLPVITRPVGGLKDFFEDGKMGYITESKDPEVYAKLIRKLLDDTNEIKKIGKYNHEYAKNRFLASKVAKSLEQIYKDVLYS